jgi:hypothetical protein
MKALLTDAVAVGNATARAILFATRDERTTIYPDRQWFTPAFAKHEFLNSGERLLDARVMMHYHATGVTPVMFAARPGSGSAYVFAARDSRARDFDGGKTYKITLPGPVPAGPSTENRPELADFRPVVVCELGCRWVLMDRCRSASGHTFGHSNVDTVGWCSPSQT